MVPTPRQTQTYIQQLLRSQRLQPKNKMGQNFLIDLNLLEVILQAADLSEGDAVLEVGTGTGGLTARLCEHAGAVLSVELDGDFQRLAQELLGKRANLLLYHGDILAGKNNLNGEVLALWDRVTHLPELPPRQRKLVANLPYVVATPVVANLLLQPFAVERMVVMVQWEMAERLIAQPATKDYGALSVLVQSLANVELIRRLGPTVFWPQPAVDSAIVCIRPDPAKRSCLPDPQAFRAFLRALYTHRRKNLRQALAGWPTGKKEKTKVDALLEALNFNGQLRSEVLDLEQHRQLFEAFQKME